MARSALESAIENAKTAIGNAASFIRQTPQFRQITGQTPLAQKTSSSLSDYGSFASQRLRDAAQTIQDIRTNPKFAANYPKDVERAVLDLFPKQSLSRTIVGYPAAAITKSVIGAPITFATQKPPIEKVGDIIKGTGAVAAPVTSVAFGLGNIPLTTAITGITQRRLPTREEVGKSFGEGYEFGTEFGPISKISGAVLSQFTKINPVFKKFNPVELKTASDVIRRLTTVGTRGAVGFGTYGAFQPAEDINQRIKNIGEHAIFGALADAGITAGGLTVRYGAKQAKVIFDKMVLNTRFILDEYAKMTPKQQEQFLQAGGVRLGKEEKIIKTLPPYSLVRSGVDTVWHETSPQSARDIVFAHKENVGLNVATSPELALGQKGQGVKIELDASQLSGRKIIKPSSDFISETSGKHPEYQLFGAPSNLTPYVKSVTFDQPLSPKGERLFFGLRNNWKATKEILPNGKVKYTNPDYKSISKAPEEMVRIAGTTGGFDTPRSVAEERGLAFYDQKGVYHTVELPKKTIKEPTLEEIEQAEQQILNEVKNEVIKDSVIHDPSIAQFKNTLLAAVRTWNLGKKAGDIATIEQSLSKNPKYQGPTSLNAALETLREKRIEIGSMEELATLVKKFGEKPMKIDMPTLAGELGDPSSGTRQAIRNMVTRRINAEKEAGKGQIKVMYDERGQPLELTKGFTGLLRKKRGTLPPLIIAEGQKTVPGSGIIPPAILERIIEKQMRTLRELRKRSGVTAKEFKTITAKVIGKSSIAKTKATVEERKTLQDMLQPQERQKLLAEVVKVREEAGVEKARIITKFIEKFKTASPLEEQFGGIKKFKSALDEITLLARRSEDWPKLPTGKENVLRRLGAFVLPFVRRPLGAQIAGIEDVFYAPALAVFKVSRNVADDLEKTLKDVFSTLTKDEQRAVLFLTTGLRGSIFKGKFNRPPTEKELQHAQYLHDIFNAHLTFINMTRDLAGQKQLHGIKNYIPFILNETIAEITRVGNFTKFQLPRLKTNKDFMAGLFSQDPARIIQIFTPSSEYYTRIHLFNAFLRDRAKTLGEKEGIAGAFSRSFTEEAVYGKQAGISLVLQGTKVTTTAVNELVGKIAPRKILLTEELKASLRNTEFGQDPQIKAMIDKGVLTVPREWMKIPNVGDVAMKYVYAAKLAMNPLFTAVNLMLQTPLGIPFASQKALIGAYWQFAKYVTTMPKEQRLIFDKAMKAGKAFEFAEQEMAGIEEKKTYEKLNDVLNTVVKIGTANIRLSEIVNRGTSFWQSFGYLKGKKVDGRTISDEDAYKVAAGFSKFINVASGGEYAAPLSQIGFIGKMVYMFTNFPLQALDISQRAIRYSLSDSEVRKFWKMLGESENVSPQTMKFFEQMPLESKARVGRLFMATVPPIVLLAQLTGSWTIAQRYIPGVSFIPDFQSPFVQLANAVEAWQKDPDGEYNNLIQQIQRTFDVVQVTRTAQAIQILQSGVIRDKAGKPSYYTEPGDWGTAARVWLFGTSVLPQVQERQELFKEGLEEDKAREEKTKQLRGYVQKSQQIARDQGVDKSTEYLLGLPLEEKDLDRLIDLMEQEELKIGGVERSLLNMSVAERAKHIYKKTQKYKTEDEQKVYLQKLFDQKILTPDTMVELQRLYENPPAKTILEQAGDAVMKLLPIGKVEASSLTLLQEMKKKQEQKKYGALAPEIQEKLKTADAFKEVRAMMKKYSGTTFGQSLIDKALQEQGITQDMLDYDDKTLLEDSLQLEQIKFETGELTGDEKLAALVSMRYVSPGSQKPLLTDEIVNKLVKEDFIDKTTGTYLKNIIWGTKDKKFSYKSSGTGVKKKKLTIPKIRIAKTPKLKLKASKAIKPLAQTRATSSRIRLSIPKTPTFKPQRVSLRVRQTMPKLLSGVGRGL